MPQQTINIGAAPDDGTGDTLRVGGDKINDNFTELYTDKADKAGGTFTGDISVPDEAYDATAWNGSLEVPTKNAVRDKIESLGSGITELDDIPDVNAPTPANGDVLTWDSTPGEWVSAAPTGGSNALDDLTDVDAPTPSDGDVLTFDSGSGDWVPAAPAAGGGDWEIIDVQSASGSATLDFPIVPTDWDELELTALDVVNATDATDLWLRVGTGGGPTYATGASDYSFVKHGLFGSSSTGTHFTATDTTFDAMQFPMTGISNVAGETQTAKVYISGLDTGVNCTIHGKGGGWKSDNTILAVEVSGRYNSTTAITALRVMASTGNITSGKFILRGRAVAV